MGNRNLADEGPPDATSRRRHRVRPITKVGKYGAALRGSHSTQPRRLVQQATASLESSPLCALVHLGFVAHIEVELTVLHAILDVHVVKGEAVRQVAEVDMAREELDEPAYI